MKTRPAHWWLARVAPALGVLYLVVCPPFLTADERTQLATGDSLTRAGWSARLDAQGAYVLVPPDFLRAADAYAPLATNAQARVDAAAWWRELRAPAAPGPAQRMAVDPDVRSPLPALPGAAGIGLGRALGLSALAQLYLARASALVVYTLAVVGAAALADPLGWLFFALALTPGVVLRAACNGTPTLADALALLVFALTVRMARDTTRRGALALVLLASGLALCQSPCLVLIPFVTLLAFEHLPVRHRWLSLVMALLGTSILIAVQCVYDARPLVPFDGSLAERLSWPLRQPSRALRTLRLTLFRRGDEAVLELLALPAALTQQLRFVGSFVATVHGQLLFALSAGALHTVLPAGRTRSLARGAMLAALLCTLAQGINFLLAEPQLRPPVLDGFTGAPFFPAFLALSLGLACGVRPLAARWLTRRPIVRIVLPLVLLHVYCLAALAARFHLTPALPFPY